MKHLYALLTRNCDLHCPHCGVAEYKNETYNEEKVLEAIKNFDGTVTLFGGECTLYEDRFIKALDTKNIDSVSSNLLNLSGKRLEKFKGEGFVTSWNLHRFTEEQYNTWLKNLNTLSELDSEFIILITLTPDLIDRDPNEIINIISSWQHLKGLQSFRFEQLIDYNQTQEFYDRVDDWLCDFHYKYNNSGCTITNEIEENVERWVFNCHNEYTLYPDGKIVNLCPMDALPTICNLCINCKYSNVCTPCRLQKYCTFPKKLYEILKKEKGE